MARNQCDSRAAELRAPAVPHAEPDPRQRRGNIPHPDRLESIPGLTPDSPGDQRRHDRASPSAAALSAVRDVGTCARHGTTFCMETARDAHARRDFRLDKRFTNGLMVMTSYTWSHLTEQVAPLNPWDELEDRIGCDRPAASHHARQRGRAALRPRTPLRRRLECRHWTPSSAGGSSARSTNGRAARRWCSTRTRTTTRNAAIPSS